jgi:hypothetical protein
MVYFIEAGRSCYRLKEKVLVTIHRAGDIPLSSVYAKSANV